MNKYIEEKETKETRNILCLKDYSHIIIYFDEIKETHLMRMVNNDEKLDEIKKELNKCTIISIKEIQQEKSNEKLNTSERVQDALSYATKMHQNQYRHDGTAYIVHPIRVANYVKKYKLSHNLEDLYIAALLHDVIEDSETSYYDIISKFGIQVASLVLELTNDEDLLKELGKTKYLKLKMKNMSNWALVIKLCDRLDNTCDLMCSNETFRYNYVQDTIEIINYIMDNRCLTKTHLNIIKEIVNRLYFVTDVYKYKDYEISLEETNNKAQKLTKSND